MGLSFHVEHCYALQTSLLARIISCFCLLETYKVTSSAMETSCQGGGFQVRGRLNPLGPESEAHGVLSNSDLLSTSGRQPRAKTIVYIFWGGSLALL